MNTRLFQTLRRFVEASIALSDAVKEEYPQGTRVRGRFNGEGELVDYAPYGDPSIVVVRFDRAPEKPEYVAVSGLEKVPS